MWSWSGTPLPDDRALLRRYNTALDPARHVRFHGLEMYGTVADEPGGVLAHTVFDGSADRPHADHLRRLLLEHRASGGAPDAPLTDTATAFDAVLHTLTFNPAEHARPRRSERRTARLPRRAARLVRLADPARLRAQAVRRASFSPGPAPDRNRRRAGQW
ncbi:hypothetical protein GTY54_07685 [Streptomyces sp. SID625]|nr:hypothetical protein [Streptomyces sp. SID625]